MLRLEGLTKRFGSTEAVADLSLEVGQGEFLSLLGPSGCGKTTTLRMIAGFETPTSGRIVVGGRDVAALPPQRREMGMVFQSYALFPHLDVNENVAFGLRSQGVARGEIGARVARALARVDLDGYERRRVQALSGGQQQRVALARALAPEPPLLLLDEPLSNLDAALRERTRTELRSLLKRVGITAVFVTHDQEEAFDLSDRIAVLRAGALQQVGTPEDLYDRPANAFVASFVGRASFVPGRLVDGEGAGRAGDAGTAGDADHRGVCEMAGGARWPVRMAAGVVPGGQATVMARPESLRLVRPGAVGDSIPGRVEERRFAGSVTMYRVRTDTGAELLVSGSAGGAAVGETVGVALAEGSTAHAFPAEAEAEPAGHSREGGNPGDRASDGAGPVRHSREGGNPGERAQPPGFPLSRE